MKKRKINMINWVLLIMKNIMSHMILVNPKKDPIFYLTIPCIWDSGRMDSNMGEVNVLGKMAQFMKGTGNIILDRAKVD